MEMDFSFLTHLEKRLIQEGFASFSTKDKNELIAWVANKESKVYSEVSEQTLLDYHKKIKIELLSDYCDDLIMKGFEATNGHTYRTNKDDQVSLIGKAVQLQFDSAIEEVNWKTEDTGGYITHTREEFIQVFLEGVNHKESTLFKFNTLKQQILNAQTDAEVLIVKWA